ncbi:hypothetical protein H9P43_004288 [Blastocladiella emersonii ATCC 22665]|nr:hypothetical protein H9P43_004288 [Blastocladiella emersonii ATCC 22665]
MSRRRLLVTLAFVAWLLAASPVTAQSGATTTTSSSSAAAASPSSSSAQPDSNPAPLLPINPCLLGMKLPEGMTCQNGQPVRLDTTSSSTAAAATTSSTSAASGTATTTSTTAGTTTTATAAAPTFNPANPYAPPLLNPLAPPIPPSDQPPVPPARPRRRGRRRDPDLESVNPENRPPVVVDPTSPFFVPPAAPKPYGPGDPRRDDAVFRRDPIGSNTANTPPADVALDPNARVEIPPPPVYPVGGADPVDGMGVGVQPNLNGTTTTNATAAPGTVAKSRNRGPRVVALEDDAKDEAIDLAVRELSATYLKSERKRRNAIARAESMRRKKSEDVERDVRSRRVRREVTADDEEATPEVAKDGDEADENQVARRRTNKNKQRRGGKRGAGGLFKRRKTDGAEDEVDESAAAAPSRRRKFRGVRARKGRRGLRVRKAGSKAQRRGRGRGRGRRQRKPRAAAARRGRRAAAAGARGNRLDRLRRRLGGVRQPLNKYVDNWFKEIESSGTMTRAMTANQRRAAWRRDNVAANVPQAKDSVQQGLAAEDPVEGSLAPFFADDASLLNLGKAATVRVKGGKKATKAAAKKQKKLRARKTRTRRGRKVNTARRRPRRDADDTDSTTATDSPVHTSSTSSSRRGPRNPPRGSRRPSPVSTSDLDRELANISDSFDADIEPPLSRARARARKAKAKAAAKLKSASAASKKRRSRRQRRGIAVKEQKKQQQRGIAWVDGPVEVIDPQDGSVVQGHTFGPLVKRSDVVSGRRPVSVLVGDDGYSCRCGGDGKESEKEKQQVGDEEEETAKPEVKSLGLKFDGAARAAPCQCTKTAGGAAAIDQIRNVARQLCPKNLTPGAGTLRNFEAFAYPKVKAAAGLLRSDKGRPVAVLQRRAVLHDEDGAPAAADAAHRNKRVHRFGFMTKGEVPMVVRDVDVDETTAAARRRAQAQRNTAGNVEITEQAARTTMVLARLRLRVKNKSTLHGVCTLKDAAVAVKVGGKIVASRLFPEGTLPESDILTLAGRVPEIDAAVAKESGKTTGKLMVEAVVRYHEKDCLDMTRLEVYHTSVCSGTPPADLEDASGPSLVPAVGVGAGAGSK